MVDLFEEVLVESRRCSSLYRGSAKDRHMLLKFLEEDLVPCVYARVPKKMLISESQLEVVQDRFVTWLKAYGHTDAEKLDILLGHFKDTHPSVCQAYAEFKHAMQNGTIRLNALSANWTFSRSSCCWQVLDHLLYVTAEADNYARSHIQQDGGEQENEHRDKEQQMEEQINSRLQENEPLFSLTSTAFPWTEGQRNILLRESEPLMPAVHCQVLAYFLDWSAQRQAEKAAGKLKTYSVSHPWTPSACYLVPSRRVHAYDNGAYPMEDYMTMAQLTFRDDAIEANHLIEKAAQDRNYADLWLFVAICLVSSIRKTDIQRLPIPALEEKGPALRQKILNDKFSISESKKLVNTWSLMIRATMGQPSKTRKAGYVPDVVLVIPTSLQDIFGKILALAMSWREEGDPFLSDVRGLNSELRSFFGESFVQACHGRNFSLRRATKSYLQGIEMTDALQGKSKIHGYLLAAIARSHKGKLGSLPATTEIYLRDAGFAGYPPAMVAYEMFERGVFGFLPAMLLERYNREIWRAMDVHTQTQVIQASGFTSVQAEHIASAVMTALDQAEKACKALFADGVSGEQVWQALKKLAESDVPERHPSMMCMRQACGLRCNAPDRTSCLGCGNEVYTRATVHLLWQEYIRIQDQLQTYEPSDASRLAALADMVLEALQNVLTAMEHMAPGEGTELLKDILQRRVRDAGY